MSGRFVVVDDGLTDVRRANAAGGRKLSRAVEDGVTAEVAKLVGVLSSSERERLAGSLAQIVAGTALIRGA